jgi:hypothetical protein
MSPPGRPKGECRSAQHEDTPVGADPSRPIWARSELLQLLSTSGTLSGLCITAVALLHSLAQATAAGTVADDLLAFSALAFLVCCYMIFFCLRTRNQVLALSLERIADGLFLLALTGMVMSGFVMLYTIV